MSTLSLSIIALIVVVLVIVIAHNLWQAYRRSQEDPLADIRASRLDTDPDTLTGAESMAHGRDRREPVLGDAARRVPPSLAARPAQVADTVSATGMAAGFDDSGADALRAARGEGQHPSLALEDEDFIETPFENPAAVRPWSSREEPANRPARAASMMSGASSVAAASAPAFRSGQRPVHREADDGQAWQDEADVRQPMMAGERDVAFRASGGQRHGAPLHAGAAESMGRDGWQDDFPAQTLRASVEGKRGAVPAPRVDTTHELEAAHGQGPERHAYQAAHQAYGSEGSLTDADRAEARASGLRAEAGVASASPSSETLVSNRPQAGTAPAASVDDAAGAAADVQADAVGHDAVEPEDWPTAQVEHAVILEPPAPVNTDRLIALTSSLRHVGSKPVRIEVERLGGHWSTLAAGDKAVRMRCSLLLANRQGPLNAVELSDFNAAIESLAVQLQAPVNIPDMAPILRVARDLDALAARLDTQIEVIVELSESPDPGKLAAIARQQGLSDRGHGRYEAFADSGDSLFTLALSKTRDQIVFVLDVPRTAEHHEAWQGMVACASSFAQALGGRLIDSAGRGLSVGMIEAVARQLSRRYVELAQAGLAAGQPATLRVFH